MDVTLLCPNLNCKAVLQVPEAARGKTVRCGHCGQTFRVPLKKKPVEESKEAAQAGAGDVNNDSQIQT